MTVITKLGVLLGRKPGLVNSPLVTQDFYDPEQMTSPHPDSDHHVYVQKSYCFAIMRCYTFFLLTMAVIGITLGLILFSGPHEFKPPRYKGYCAIPIDVTRDDRQDEAFLSHMPLQWTTEPEVTVLSTVDEQGSRDPVYNLVERFDIEDNVEKISVFNNGHLVEFIHDFNVNVTGIVDTKRCFIMELDLGAVLRPGELVRRIAGGGAFDVARVRGALRALLPPGGGAPDVSSSFAEKCNDKPTYELKKGTGEIRKRSVDNKTAHDFEFFAGNNIQEISIANFQELLKYESKLPGEASSI